MPQYERSILDLPQKQLSPSTLCSALARSSITQAVGGIGLLGKDMFSVNFTAELSAEEEAQLDEILAVHDGNGPDTVFDMATVQAVADAADAAAAAAAEAAD